MTELEPRVTIILPGHGLDDLPTWHAGPDAAEMLGAWTFGWHPRLIVETGGMPAWLASFEANDPDPGTILAVPRATHDDLDPGWLARVESDFPQVHLMKGLADRRQAADEALTWLDSSPNAEIDRWADEFFALGYTYLMVEILTRSMRYSSHVDHDALRKAALEAALAAQDQADEVVRSKLTRCYDLLTEARSFYYPVDSYLVDVMLIAPTVWGEATRKRLDSSVPVNVLVGGQQLEEWQTAEPASTQALQTAWEQGTASLLGGMEEENSLYAASCEAMAEQVRQGRESYERVLGRAPEVFGRFAADWNPHLPSVLQQSGFRGVLLSGFDGGNTPELDQSKAKWEGPDGTTIDAVSRQPLDTGEPGTFLSLAKKIGESMDHDHTAIVLLAGWPGHASVYYEDLLRSAEYGGPLGKFVTLEELFSSEDSSDFPQKLAADSFAVSPSGQTDPQENSPDPGNLWCVSEADRREFTRLQQGLAAWVANSIGLENVPAEKPADPWRPLVERLAGAESATGRLTINPSPQAGATSWGGAGQELADEWLGDIPVYGFAWQEEGHSAAPPKSLVEGNLLRNEFGQVTISDKSGGIGEVHDYHHRSNLVSQQLALHYRKNGQTFLSRMKLTEPLKNRATAAAGDIEARGVLVDGDNNPLASFVQRVEVRRKSRLVLISGTIEPVDGWKDLGIEAAPSAAIRWAWKNESAEIWRDIAGAMFSTQRKNISTARVVEVRDHTRRVALLTGQPIDYRRWGPSGLESRLGAGKTIEFQWALAIGADNPQGLIWGEPFFCWPAVEGPAPQGGNVGWWIDLGSAALRCTAIDPSGEGMRQLRLRIQETGGRARRTRIETFLPIEAARRIDLNGQTVEDLAVENGAVPLSVPAYGWMTLELNFATTWE